MSNNSIFFIGVLGVSLLAASFILGGLLIENYDIVSQFISESYAIDTEYGLLLRIFGYIPSSILITLFCFLAVKHFQSTILVKIGFYGIGIFYGLASLVTGIFPCDSGCNRELINPSFSQITHNVAALLMYLFSPISIIIIGIGLKQMSNYNRLSIIAITLGLISILFVYLFFSDLSSEFLGLYQRIIESVFIIWILSYAFTIKQSKLITKEISNDLRQS
jgi:hypothetical protein|tara:strand:+ start:91 stop:750 length:660 start_codon:yes stop_codon:yes gene_type:complete